MSGDATRCADADDERDGLVESDDATDAGVHRGEANDAGVHRGEANDAGVRGRDSNDRAVDDPAPGDGNRAPAEPATVQRELRRRAEAVRRRERDRALERLEAAGDLTDDQRRAIDALSSALADGIVDRADALLRDRTGEDGERGVDESDVDEIPFGADGVRCEGSAAADRDREETAAALRELFLSDP